MDSRPVLDLIAAARQDEALILVGIGGHGAAGKTTLARMVPGAQIVSTDEFWDGEALRPRPARARGRRAARPR